jgi:hypothetical protein
MQPIASENELHDIAKLKLRPLLLSSLDFDIKRPLDL